MTRSQQSMPRSRMAVLLAVAAFAGTARADQLVWLTPSRAGPGLLQVGLTQVDGAGRARLPAPETVVSAAGARLVARGEQGSARIFEVQAEPGELRLVASAGALSAKATVAVGAPGARVSIEARPPRPVKGKDEDALLAIEILTADGHVDADAPAPVIRANVGEVAAPRAVGPGRFEARYRLPRARYPEVAIVVAFAPWPHADAAEGAFGALAIPLAAAVNLPGRTEPDVAIELEIAGARFGPVQAASDGAFELPIVVPPGHRFATSVATDRAGNRRRQKLDLRLPPTDRIACVANPAALPADGKTRARVLCLASDPFGKPLAGARVLARASAGRLEGPRALAAGLQEWSYLPPTLRERPQGVLEFEFPAGGEESRERVELLLSALPAARAKLEVGPQPVFLNVDAAARLTTEDPAGRPVESRPRLWPARGTLSEWRASAGEQVTRYRPPAALGDWRDEIRGEVLPSAGTVPARLRCHLEDAELQVRAEALSGHPVPGVELTLDGQSPRSTDEAGIARFPFAACAPGETVRAIRVQERTRRSLQAEAWLMCDGGRRTLFPEEGPFQRIELSVPVALAPAAPVDVQIELVRSPEGGRAIRYRVVGPRGDPLLGRAVRIEAVSGTKALEPGPSRLEDEGWTRAGLSGPEAGPVAASVTDLATGVSAVRREQELAP